MSKQSTPSYGIEVEKAFSAEDGSPHIVGNPYFERLYARKQARGEKAKIKKLKDVAVGVSTPYGEESLDNSFALGESATGPIFEQDGGLNKLHEIVTQELQDVEAALQAEGAVMLNMSNHPLIEINAATYKRTVAPKPVYDYLNNVRGWEHMAGIDAKAQNSPSTGIAPTQAVQAVNATMAIGAAFIALYANSPFESGKVTGLQESRMAIWTRMFGRAHAAGDRRLHLMPEKPFANLRDYFEWMFADDTNMFFVMSDSSTTNVKGEQALIVIDDKPSLLKYLRSSSWKGTVHGTTDQIEVSPTMHHFALHQFTQFSAARIRYGFNDQPFAVEDFNRAMAGTGLEVDELFARQCAYTYIEGRDPGANFADAELLSLTNDPDVARSVVMSSGAIQAGVLRNLKAAEALIAHYGWETLVSLRNAAIKDGLEAEANGKSVRILCEEVLKIAESSLDPNEQWLLAYPKFVLSTGLNGATRAVQQYASLSGSPRAKMQTITKARAAIIVS